MPKGGKVMKEVMMSEDEQMAEITSDAFMITKAGRNYLQSIPLFIPRHFVVAAGIGVTELNNPTVGLEAALLATKIDHLNLVRLTSALPKCPMFTFADEARIVIPTAAPTPAIYNYAFVKAKKSGELTMGLEFFHASRATIVIEADEPLCRARLPGLVHHGHSLITLKFANEQLVDFAWEFKFGKQQFTKSPPIYYFSDNPNGKYFGVFVGILVLP